MELGTKYKFLSVVLEAPFMSISEIAKKRYMIYPTKYLTLNLIKIVKIILNMIAQNLIIIYQKLMKLNEKLLNAF